MAEQYVITVVLEGNVDSMSKSMDNAASSQRNVKRATDDTNLAFLAQIARYQAMTAALNQTIGGFNKLAGGMDRLGFKEQAALIRKFTAYLEIIAGPAEIYLAYLTLTIAFGKKDITTKAGQTVATGALTTATKALNVAMSNNQYLILLTGTILLLGVMLSLTKGIDNTKSKVDLLTDSFRRLRDMWSSLLELANPFDNILESEAWVGKNRMNSQMGG